jgi:DNA polymerase III delta subunit
MIVRQARQILVARDLIQRRVDAKAAMERLGLRMPFHWEKLEKAARKYGAQELEAFVRRAPELEILVKRSGSNAAPEAVLTWILALLIRPASSRAGTEGGPRRTW